MNNSNANQPTALNRRTWGVMVALAVTGQIAWAVENSWFNKFIAAEITPDPRPIAWMVAASAVVATLTTIVMGTLSDRTRTKWGRRKPYILFGYILWGLMTAVFPMTALIKNVSVAVIAVILVDCLMTFFGSTANDAAFNAWTVDVTPPVKRGRVEGVLQLCLFIAQLVSYTAAGMLIDKAGYFTFFYLLGGIVMVVGLVAGSALPEPPLPAVEAERKPFWKEVGELFNLRTVVQNRTLFILLIVIMVTGIGFQVAFPYMIIYITDNLGMSLEAYTIIGGAVIVGSAILAIPMGFLAEKWNERWMLLGSIVLMSLGCYLFSTTSKLILLALYGLLWQAMNMVGAIASMAWLKDLLPEESRGRFMGVRMIFWIALPMVIGPSIGSALIRAYGIPTTLNGAAGFIPVPVIFQVGALITLLAIVPLMMLKPNGRSEGTIQPS